MFETEVVNRHGPSKKLTEVEFALMEWVDLYNNARLHSRLDYLTPPNTRAPTTLNNHHADRRWSEPEAGPELVTVHSVSTRHNQVTSILPRTTGLAPTRTAISWTSSAVVNEIESQLGRGTHWRRSGVTPAPDQRLIEATGCSCLKWVCGFYHQPPTRQLQVAQVPIFDVPRRGHEPANVRCSTVKPEATGRWAIPTSESVAARRKFGPEFLAYLGRNPHTKQVRHGDRA
ncbi:integrase core domain-containing protein [Nocardia gipuzkoensis]